jgi:hypothetical protein
MDQEIAPTFEKWIQGVKQQITQYSIPELKYLLNWAENASFYDTYNELIELIKAEINARHNNV